MEQPKSLDSNDIRNEKVLFKTNQTFKVKLLNCIPPIIEEEVLIGQYCKSEDGTKPAYIDDDGVDKSSNTPTFAAMVLRINNERWNGVPFIIKCGKGNPTNFITE